MSSRQVHFFATRDDQLELLENIEHVGDFKYILSGQYDENIPNVYSKGRDIPSLGIARHENAINGDSYLVMRPLAVIRAREIRQSDGRTRYAVDQFANQISVVFMHGGFHGDVLLYGKIGTASNHPQSIELYKPIRRALQFTFKRAGTYFLGKRAKEFLDEGGRLTQAIQSPSEYDLPKV